MSLFPYKIGEIMSLGCLMIDLQGHTLTDEERTLLKHPLIGGVILFSRNYVNAIQLTELIAEIHSLRHPPLLVSVDHEGGRVQRFRQDFVRLPASAHLGQLYGKRSRDALHVAKEIGWLLAAELRAVGVDFSFTPVLDLGNGISSVIDDRAYHADPDIITNIAIAQTQGMLEAGMQAVGKHYPGHGSVAADSHHEIPIDERTFSDIQMADLIPFERMIRHGLPAIMPAHVIYSKIDALPAGFSTYWLQHVLRHQLGFEGAIFSDDLSMEGASSVGDGLARAHAALKAGCDMLLICNARAMVYQVIEGLGEYYSPVAQVRLMRLRGKPHPVDWHTLHRDPRWAQAQALCHNLEHAPELILNDDELH